MRNTWKVLVIVVLVTAVAAILVGKRKVADTAPTPLPPTSRELAAEPSPSHGQAEGISSGGRARSRGAVPAAPVLGRDGPSAGSGSPLPQPQGTPRAQSRGGPGGKLPKQPSPNQRPAPPAATGAKPNPTAMPKQGALPQLIELGSKTCVPCQRMQPILEELRKEYKGQLEVPFWDIYDHPDKAKSYGIRVIPTQVFIGPDGREFFRHEGFFPREEIIAKFREHGVTLNAAAEPE